MSLRGFATLNFWADDVAAVSWYTELLGVEPYFNRPGPDGRPVYVEFGNVLGAMYNPHYVEVLASRVA